MLTATTVRAQEAVRASMAGQDAAEARKRNLTVDNLNVKLGPVGLRLQSSVEVEANDNVRLADDDPLADLIFRPQVRILTAWQATEKNRLSLDLGVGYSKYLNAHDLDGLFLTPGSDLSFDVYVKDVVINLHDRFSYSQDPTSDATVSGVGSLSRFENTLGVGVMWDLNKVILRAGYDHYTYLATQSEFSYQSRASELFVASAAFVVNPFTLVGVETGAGITDYDENVLNDNHHLSAGLFFSMRVSEYSSLRVSVGYVNYAFESLSGTNQSLAPIGGFYGDLSWQQRVNASMTHSLSVGHSLQSGTSSDVTELTYVRYSAQWRLFRQTSLGTSIGYEQFTENAGSGDTGRRYSFSLNLGRPWTRHLSSSLGYQVYVKNSDAPNQDYVQNRLVLDLIYSF